MTAINNPVAFAEDYDALRTVSLNPERHTAANAWEHCEQVRTRVLELAGWNGCTDEETQLLDDLARIHDIGKILGTAKPEKSVELLSRYDVTDERLTALVKYHDTNLPWFLAAEKGQPPSDKAWNRLARKTPMRLLCLFMVADRIDCPGGWQENKPLVWFLKQAQERNLLERPLVLGSPEDPERQEES